MHEIVTFLWKGKESAMEICFEEQKSFVFVK